MNDIIRVDGELLKSHFVFPRWESQDSESRSNMARVSDSLHKKRGTMILMCWTGQRHRDEFPDLAITEFGAFYMKYGRSGGVIRYPGNMKDVSRIISLATFISENYNNTVPICTVPNFYFRMPARAINFDTMSSFCHGDSVVSSHGKNYLLNYLEALNEMMMLTRRITQA